MFPRVFSAAAVAGLLVFSASASAALQVINLGGTVSSVPAGFTTFAVGDRYSFTLTIDDSVTDTAVGVGGGQFPNLVTAFSGTADPGNTGSWLPSGTYDAPSSNFVTNAFGSNLTLQIHGTGFPDAAAGWTFWDFTISSAWPPGITDNGSGDTFADQLGAPLTEPPAYFSFVLRFTDGVGNYNEVAFTSDTRPLAAPGAPAAAEAIPGVPASGLLLLAVGLGALGARRLRGKRAR